MEATTAGATETAPLSSLLERERACVGVVVALARGTTERAERETCASLGGDLVVCCCALRERLELAGAPVTRATSPDGAFILGADPYDARLLAFAEFLERTAEQATEILAATGDDATQRTLRDLIATHGRAAGWCRARAAEFAATRMLYLPADPVAAEPPGDQLGGPGGSSDQTGGSGEASHLPVQPTEGSEPS